MEFNLDLKNKIIDDESLRWVEIYKITNVITNKCYIGQVVSHTKCNNKYYPKGIAGRFKEHMKEAIPRQKYHCNALNNAVRTHGKDNFKVELICYTSVADANRVETDEIRKHNSLVPNGYNINTSCNSFLPCYEFREKVSVGNINTHLKRHLKKFENYREIINEFDFDKYITPRNKNGQQIGWYLRLNKIIIEFKSTIEPMEKIKERAIEFLKLLNEKNKLTTSNTAKLRETTLEPNQSNKLVNHYPVCDGNAQMTEI